MPLILQLGVVHRHHADTRLSGLGCKFRLVEGDGRTLLQGTGPVVVLNDRNLGAEAQALSHLGELGLRIEGNRIPLVQTVLTVTLLITLAVGEDALEMLHADFVEDKVDIIDSRAGLRTAGLGDSLDGVGNLRSDFQIDTADNRML